MRWSVTTPATGTVLTWYQLKHHIRPGSVQEQTYIVNDLLPQATAYAETMLECCLLPQTITAIYDIQDIGHFNMYWSGVFNEHRRGLQLPRGPVIGNITSVTDANNAAVQYRWHTVGNSDFIEPLQQITSAPITVVYQAGFTTVPPDIIGAIRIHTATLYRYREDIDNLPANAIHKIDDFYRFRGRGSFVG